jgi:hypothetical protein
VTSTSKRNCTAPAATDASRGPSREGDRPVKHKKRGQAVAVAEIAKIQRVGLLEVDKVCLVLMKICSQ